MRKWNLKLKKKNQFNRESNKIIPKQLSDEEDHPQFKIDKKKLRDRISLISKYSLGLTESALISRLMVFLETKLPLGPEDIRKYLIYCFKAYSESNSVPLQKFALLPQDERMKAIENFKNIFIRNFSEIIVSKEGTPSDYLLLIFEDYFKEYE